MIHLLESLKDICDIVIVDGPPTQLVTDSLILARIADSTVIIAEGNKTKKESLRRIVDNIQKVGGKIAGVVLNKVKLSAKNYEQSYYYGSTGMVISNKNKKGKRDIRNREDISYAETRNRNTERARQLVKQNKKDEKIEKEKEKFIESFIEEPVKNVLYKKEEKNDNYIKEEKNDNYIKEEKKEEVKQEYEKEPSKEIVASEMPTFLKNNIILEKEEKKEQDNFIKNQENNTKIEIENADMNDLDEKTRDIIRPVNEYLENEKKNLNN